jgi:hypothetical protein
MHDDDLRREFGTLLRSVRETAPPELPVIRHRLSRLRRRRVLTAGTSSVLATAAVVLTVVAVHPGPTAPSGSHSASTGQWWKAPYTVTTPVTTLVVTGNVATITVVGSQRSTTSVSVTMTYSHRAPTVTRQLTGRTLQLGGACPDNENCNVSITVQVPRASAARVTDSVGDISVSGLTGPVIATDDTGNISLTSLSGPATATDSVGDIYATNMISRRLTLQDDTGDISATMLTPPDSLQAVNSVGAIDIGLPGSASYRVNAPDDGGLTSVSATVPVSASSPYSITADDDTGSVSITTGKAGSADVTPGSL